jgi:hypothetical protein
MLPPYVPISKSVFIGVHLYLGAFATRRFSLWFDLANGVSYALALACFRTYEISIDTES